MGLIVGGTWVGYIVGGFDSGWDVGGFHSGWNVGWVLGKRVRRGRAVGHGRDGPLNGCPAPRQSFTAGCVSLTQSGRWEGGRKGFGGGGRVGLAAP